MSLAGFVAKVSTEEILRLVCDLRNLNKATEGNTSIFPNPSQVMESLSPDSTYFVTADLCSGYHQIEIAPDSGMLFCFQLYDGLYYYKCTPMGFKNSGHLFVQTVLKI